MLSLLIENSFVIGIFVSFEAVVIINLSFFAYHFLIVLLVSDTAVLLAYEFKVKHHLQFLHQEHCLAEEMVRRGVGGKRGEKGA